jgi:predicted nucleic acid-binding protein
MNEEPVLIDTSVWIQALRKDPPQPLADLVRRAILEGRTATTGMVMLELLSGARTGRHYQELTDELRALRYLSAEGAWPEACRLSFRLRRHGVTVPSADILIAAVAVVHGCVLLHADDHFPLIARHSRLLAREASRLG